MYSNGIKKKEYTNVSLLELYTCSLINKHCVQNRKSLTWEEYSKR